MGYKYRHIECFNCKHKFMWQEGTDGDRYHGYRLKDSDTYIGRAVCPSCSNEMVVLPDIFRGVPIDDPRIEVDTIRPI